MKIAVTSQGPDMNGKIDPRFGRAKFFVVVDTDSGAALSGGAYSWERNPQGVPTCNDTGFGARATAVSGPKIEKKL